MENIKYTYILLLKKNNLYFSYIRNYLLFFSEKKIINTNKHIINNYKYINHNNNFIAQLKNCDNKIILIKNDQIVKKKNINIFFYWFNLFFTYKIYNNLNYLYIKNLSKKINNLKINIKNINIKNLFIINITNNYNKNILSFNKIINIKKKINIFDIYYYKKYKGEINIQNFINIKSKLKIYYNLITLTNNLKNININYFIKQDKYTKLFFNDYINNLTNINIIYNFFLIGKYSKIKKISFKKNKYNYTDNRECNIHHYNDNSNSNVIFGTIMKEGNLIYNANIYIGININNAKAHIKCDALILKNKNYINLNPNMFINNNEVICTHGVSIGNININIINYMLSRGIKKIICKKIIIKNYIKKFINKNLLKFLNLITQKI